MVRKVAFLAALTTGIGLAPLAFAQEADPQGQHPALRCAHVATHKAQRAVHLMRHQARHCARAITILKGQGNEEQAAAVAEQCVAGINEKAAGGASAVQELIGNCVDVLSENGAPEAVITRLTEHGQRLVQRINVVRMNLIERIQAVLAGEGEGDDGGD